jgi:hypothetical protein
VVSPAVRWRPPIATMAIVTRNVASAISNIV